VIVAVIAVRMMEPAVNQIIDMIAMRDGFVPAIGAVLVRAASLRRAAHRVFGIDRDHMLIDVIVMHVMKVAVVNVIHMTIMLDCGVPAVRAVLMGVVRMMHLVASHIVVSAMCDSIWAPHRRFRRRAPRCTKCTALMRTDNRVRACSATEHRKLATVGATFRQRSGGEMTR
jgi:hypothetical protein